MTDGADAACRDSSAEGIPLTGGNTTAGVVRIGDTVRRSRDGRSAFAARALAELERLGFDAAPRHLGIDDAGRDILTWIDGVTTDHPLQRDERAYGAIGTILRRLHDLTAGTPIAAGGTCLVHGDPGPFNAVMRGGMPVALIDWDSVHPGDPMDDVGYAAWTWCILSVPNVPIADQARRMALLRDGYDATLSADAVLGAVDAAQRRITELEGENAADARLDPARRTHARRAVAWATTDRDLIAQNRELFEDALAGA